MDAAGCAVVDGLREGLGIVDSDPLAEADSEIEAEAEVDIGASMVVDAELEGSADTVSAATWLT